MVSAANLVRDLMGLGFTCFQATYLVANFTPVNAIATGTFTLQAGQTSQFVPITGATASSSFWGSPWAMSADAAASMAGSWYSPFVAGGFTANFPANAEVDREFGYAVVL